MVTINDNYKYAVVNNIIGFSANYLSEKYNIALEDVLSKMYLSDFMVELQDLATRYYEDDLKYLVSRFDAELFLN
jgi:hypothetical protein